MGQKIEFVQELQKIFKVMSYMQTWYVHVLISPSYV